MLVLIGMGFCGVANAASDVHIIWTANTEADLDGYKVYAGGVSGVYEGFGDVGNITTYTMHDVPDNKALFIAVTAYDISGNESGYSNEVVYLRDTLPPMSAIGLQIDSITIITETP